MKCFNCGSVLTGTDYCSTCGADVKLYRRLLRLSAAYYNEGLEKAKVRDLSGSVVSLRQSLKINKKNIDARNLLGLVYFEMGEVVEALSQWIISRSFQEQKNLADYYIEQVQNNPNHLQMLNTSIKKYNQSLLYCEQGSYDLAVIQLKKLLSNHKNLIKGHQLLALLYIKSEDYNKAKTELKKVLEIDCTNTKALRYMKELENVSGNTSVPKEIEKPKKDVIAYTSGNETIIQPVGVKDNSALLTIINICIGLVIGMAVMWFLIFPAQQQRVNAELNKSVAEYSDLVEAKLVEMEDLQLKISSLEGDIKDLEKNSEEKQETINLYEQLLAAYRIYAEEDYVGALESLDSISKEALSENAQALYNIIFGEVESKTPTELYRSGYSAYEKADYKTAIFYLKRSYEMDNKQGDALYFLARSYHKSGDTENAKICYQKVIDGWPNTRKATDAAALLSGL